MTTSPSRPRRVALVSSEPLRERMAGIGIRYAELARRLPRPGLEVVLSSPADPDEAPEVGLPGDRVRSFERGHLAETFADCDAAVAQGQLANDLLVECPEMPVAIDLYDPWLVENLHYAESLGYGPYKNDHATWVHQLSRGDFFLCSSDEQRLFYLGFLTAVGRINPERLAIDPDLEALIAPVPFGIPDALGEHRPYLPARDEGETRILFGGLYDWYDPWTLLEAIEWVETHGSAGADSSGWRVLLIRNPNQESTPQALFGQVEAWCRERGWWGERVVAMDWVASDRRYDLLRDVDVLVAPHRPSLETRLSLRTRFLDAMAAGCPVVATEGGTIGRLIREHDAGWTVPPSDPEALARALIAASGPEASRRGIGARRLSVQFSWDRVLEPLIDFCFNGCKDPTAEAFAFRPHTQAPAEAGVSLSRRVARRLRGMLWRKGR